MIKKARPRRIRSAQVSQQRLIRVAAVDPSVELETAFTHGATVTLIRDSVA